jgi:flagellar biosynthesis/type III secretory pathway protein FliH
MSQLPRRTGSIPPFAIFSQQVDGALCSAFQKHQVQEQTRRNIAAAIDAAAERGRAEGWKEGLARGRELERIARQSGG